jgi:hypothetical protein
VARDAARHDLDAQAPLRARDEAAAGGLAADEISREVGPSVRGERAVRPALFADQDEQSHLPCSLARELFQRHGLRREAPLGIARSAAHEDVPFAPRRNERRDRVRVGRQHDARVAAVNEEVPAMRSDLHGLHRPTAVGKAPFEEGEDVLLVAGHRRNRDELLQQVDRASAGVRRDCCVPCHGPRS